MLVLEGNEDVAACVIPSVSSDDEAEVENEEPPLLEAEAPQQLARFQLANLLPGLKLLEYSQPQRSQ